MKITNIFDCGKNFLVLSLKKAWMTRWCWLYGIPVVLCQTLKGLSVHYTKTLTHPFTPKKSRALLITCSDAGALMFLWLFCQPVQGAEFNKALILLNMYLEGKLPWSNSVHIGNVSWYWKAAVQYTSPKLFSCSPFCPLSCGGLSVKSSCTINNISQLIWLRLCLLAWLFGICWVKWKGLPEITCNLISACIMFTLYFILHMQTWLHTV